MYKSIFFYIIATVQLIGGLIFAENTAQEVGTVILFNMWFIAGLLYKEEK